MGNRLNIVIVDDHPLVLNGMALALAAHPEIVVRGSFLSFADLQASGEIGSTRLLVTDIKIQGHSCLDDVVALRQAHPELLVVGITGIDDRDLLRKIVAARLDGLVFKNEPTDELLQAIVCAASGGAYFSPEVSELITDFDRSKLEDPLEKLTPREREILKLVSSGLSAKKIAEDLHISIWTVTNHKANIMGKLGIHSQVGLTRFAIETGLT